MKKLLLVLLLFPMLAFSQVEEQGRLGKSVKYKVAMMQNFVHMGDKGEDAFWKTKGKVTYAIVNYTAEQNPVFKELFISQYRELLPIYNKMIVSYDDKDTSLFLKVLIRQEEDYRKLLTPEQLEKYRDKLNLMEMNDEKESDSYNSLFFSDSLLEEYKSKAR
jgi:hypothetical protein